MSFLEGREGRPIFATSRRRRPALWLLAGFALIALAASGCGGVSNPEGWASPVVTDEAVYITSGGGKLAKLAPETLEELWEFPDGDVQCGNEAEERERDLEGIYAAPVVDGGRVHFGAYDGNAYTLNAADGSCEWVFEDADGPIIGGIALHDGTLYFGSDDGNLYGLDPETGDVTAGPLAAGAAIWTTPLVIGDNLYFSTVGGAAHAVEAGSLEPVWEEPFEASAGLIMNPVEAGDGLVLFGGIDWRISALDAETGEKVWESEPKADNWFWGDPLIDAQRAYAPNLDGSVYAIDVSTGETLWRFETEAAVRAAPLLAGDTLLIIDRDGNIYRVDPESGQETSSNPTRLDKRILSNPIEFDGSVLVLAQGGDLYRLDPSGETPPRLVRG